jgi:UDP-N-acetylmuramoyl-L-alanyl-D-glutamate--2,6-diaminopimelate ligase
MGRAVGNGADLCLVTSDNPRTEDPDGIIDMILPGISKAGQTPISAAKLNSADRGYAVEGDRKTAIDIAMGAARPGDTVLIAGKGHEDYQILGTEKIHFDDREQARRAISHIRGGAHG